LNLPKSTSSGWLRTLIDMTITARGNAFVVRRIEREALTLLSRGGEQPELCWLVLAFCAFLRGDRNGCVRAVDAAYALANHDVVIASNAASLLINLGLPRLAVTYARRLATLSHGNTRQAVNAVNVLYAALHVEEASALLRSVEGVRPSALTAQLDGLSASFDAGQLSVEMRVALMETAVAAIESEGCRVRYTALRHCPDHTLGYDLHVDQPPSKCAQLGFSIADALVENFDNAFPYLITFSCSSLASYMPTGKFVEVAL
jgi:hypothetical protein